MDDYKEKLDKTIIEMVKQKENNDKKLLSLEILIGVLSMIILLGFTLSAAYVEMADWLKACLIISGFIIFFIGIFFAIKIEQTAGYYKCAKCGNKHIPSYNSVLFAMHFGRTRYMKCPKCGKMSWQKKVISKE